MLSLEESEKRKEQKKERLGGIQISIDIFFISNHRI